MSDKDEGSNKEKGKGFTNLELEVGAEMGCTPSQAVIIHSPPNRNENLQPTIFMVAQENFQMLRDLGELKFYHLAQYDAEETERVHHEFASRLENPVHYEREENKADTPTGKNKTMHTKLQEEPNVKSDQLSEARHKENSNSNDICITTHVSSTHPLKCTKDSAVSTSETNSAKLQSKQVGDCVENPQKCLEEVATSGLKSISVQTLETATKSKTIFRRNRIRPVDQVEQNSEYSLQRLRHDELSINAQIELTEVTELTSKPEQDCGKSMEQ